MCKTNQARPTVVAGDPTVRMLIASVASVYSKDWRVLLEMREMEEPVSRQARKGLPLGGWTRMRRYVGESVKDKGSCAESMTGTAAGVEETNLAFDAEGVDGGGPNLTISAGGLEPSRGRLGGAGSGEARKLDFSAHP